MMHFSKRIHAIIYLFAVLASQAMATEAKPNILYVTFDDMNDWVGCLDGHPQIKTPHIDRLAARGVLFANAHSAVPVCSGSRAANWTGLSPVNNGVYGNSQKIEKTLPEALFLPQDLEAQGYYTMGTGKLLHGKSNRMLMEAGPTYNKWHPILDEELKISKEELADSEPYVRHYIPRLGITMPLNQMKRDRKRGSNTIDSFDWGVIDRPESEWSDADCAEWAVEKLQEKHDKPFFLGVGIYRPHQPLWAPKKYHDMYPPESIVLPEVPSDDLDDVSQTAKDFGRYALTSGSHETVVANKEWQKAASAYMACITFADAQLGKIIDALDASPYADNTVIVLWSDHGWNLGEKEHWGKFTAWERSTHVPLVMVPAKSAEPKGFRPNAVSEATVNLLDVYPTVIDLLGLKKRSDLDGNSLYPLIQDVDSEWKHFAVSAVGRGTWTVRHPRWRYTRYFDGTEEIYDMENDPNEWTNLASDPEHESVRRRLAKAIPEDSRIRHTLRIGDFKAVVLEKDGSVELYGPSVSIVSEDKNVAKSNPKVIEKIEAYLASHTHAARHLTIPASYGE